MATHALQAAPPAVPFEEPAAPRAVDRLRGAVDRSRLLSPVLLLLVWEAASRIGWIPGDVVPAPSAILEAALELVLSGKLASHLAISLQRSAIGLAIGLSAGVIVALIAGLSRRGEMAADPLMQILRMLPFLGVIPLFILWFGIGETTKVLLIALAVKTPIYLNLYGGIRGVDRKLIEAARSLGLNRSELIWHVILPGALPSFFVGLRYALGVSLLALIAVEQINATSGIGYLINEARDFMRTDVIMVGLLVYSLLGLLTDAFVRLLERHTLAWRPSIFTDPA
ncbi:ABC transporter permease [Sphingomonas naphthae]|uniref:ABC transporter permease n=1 Tax=Sphingomonas naphthae TaxID=1813468 RepID=A0ABY7TME8_9SPHN|nr:ABC transporter permease [Sphingomonas naphthae]WCT74166.1 ABC transporter permease [Sphingomonas naphthae]